MSRRLALAAFALPVLLLLAPLPLMAAPRDDLFAAWQKFLALKSFRATITGLEPRQSVTRLEFQAPDRYRMSLQCADAETCRAAMARIAADKTFARSVDAEGRVQIPAKPSREVSR